MQHFISSHLLSSPLLSSIPNPVNSEQNRCKYEL